MSLDMTGLNYCCLLIYVHYPTITYSNVFVNFLYYLHCTLMWNLLLWFTRVLLACKEWWVINYQVAQCWMWLSLCTCHDISASSPSWELHWGSCVKLCFLCLPLFSVQILTFLYACGKLNSFKPDTTFILSKIQKGNVIIHYLISNIYWTIIFSMMIMKLFFSRF